MTNKPNSPDRMDLILAELRALRTELRLSSKSRLTVPEAADLMGISAKTLRNKLADRQNPFPVHFGKRGGKRTCLRADLERYLSEG